MRCRHGFETIVSKRGELNESRCTRCGMMRMRVAMLKARTFTASRLFFLYRPSGGQDWTTRTMGCAS